MSVKMLKACSEYIRIQTVKLKMKGLEIKGRNILVKSDSIDDG